MVDLERLMNGEEPSLEEKIADDLLDRLDKKLAKAGKQGDGQVAMRIVLMMAEGINEAGEEEE